MHTRPIPVVLIALFASLAGGANAGVRIVSVPDGPYTTIQSAVDAASDGELVLIKTGNHGGFTVDGKAVSVAIDLGSTSTIQGSVVVKNLPAGKSLALTRLRVTGTGFNGPVIGTPVRLEDCAGSVRVEVCTLNGANGSSLTGCSVSGDPSAATALRIVRCVDVGVGISTLRGGNAANLYAPGQCATGPSQGGAGGCGVEIEDANVALYDCTLIGGDGGSAYLIGGAGGDALRVVDTSVGGVSSEVFVSKCVLDGNSIGGSAWPAVAGATPGSGGSAIEAAGNCVVRTLDCSLLSGIGGCSTVGPCVVPAAAIVTGDGASVAGTVGVASVMATHRILRENQPLVITISGASQQSVLLLLSPGMHQVFSQPLHGVLLLGSPLFGPIVLGTTSSTGTAEFHLGSFILPVGVDYLPIQLQALVASGTQGTLTGSANIALLSQLF